MDKGKPDIINGLVEAGYPFALFRLPGTSGPELVLQKRRDMESFPDLRQLKAERGFMVAPFMGSTAHPGVLIRADVQQHGLNGLEPLLPTTGYDSRTETAARPGDESRTAAGPGNHVLFNKENYLSSVKELIGLIHRGKLEKAIISRTVHTKLPAGFSPGEFFFSMLESLEESFVYLVNLPGRAIWAGASPEILLLQDRGVYKTVALAGTLPANAPKWSAKEYEEQGIVAGYIEQKLADNSIEDYKRTGPYSSRSGHVAHLKTEYSFTGTGGDDWLVNLVEDLHPTPAVGGIPKEEAIAFIHRHEPHDREYYTGYLGKWNIHNETQLFVNLRCMKIQGDQATLYAGGGITGSSDPEKEWEETNMKAQTLLSILENTRRS